MNTGTRVPRSANRLLATALAQKHYAIEGSIFVAGAVVQWLRDELGLLATAGESEALAKRAKPAEGLYIVPAFTGLGAPYWRPEARGAIFGMTRDTGRCELVRAALDSVCYQTRDLLEAMRRDMKSAGLARLKTLKVDGGMVNNDWFCQRLADLTGLAVERPRASPKRRLWAPPISRVWARKYSRNEKDIAQRDGPWIAASQQAAMKARERDRLYAGWRNAVFRI